MILLKFDVRTWTNLSFEGSVSRVAESPDRLLNRAGMTHPWESDYPSFIGHH